MKLFLVIRTTKVLKLLFLIIVVLTLCLFLLRNFFSFINNDFFGVWIFVCLCVFLLAVTFLDKYKKIGKIILKSDRVIIEVNNEKRILALDSLEIEIYYKGYEGEFYNFTIDSLEGIGEIFIRNLNQNESYSFIVENKNTIVELLKVQELYRNNNVNFIIRDKSYEKN